MAEKNIEFEKLKIHKDYGQPIKDIFHVVKNGRSIVMDAFRALGQNEKDLIIDLISKMATNKDFRSPKITHHLKGYNYGEIKPMPHRFFFFQKYGKNIIFFHYIEKKKNEFKNRFYKNLNKEKKYYEEQFKKFIK